MIFKLVEKFITPTSPDNKAPEAKEKGLLIYQKELFDKFEDSATQDEALEEFAKLQGDKKELFSNNKEILRRILLSHGPKAFNMHNIKSFLDYMSELEFDDDVEDKLEYVYDNWQSLKDAVNEHKIFKSKSLYLDEGNDIKDFKYFLNILKVLADDNLKSKYFDLNKKGFDGKSASDIISIDSILQSHKRLLPQSKVFEKIDSWTEQFGATSKEKENNSKDESKPKISNYNIINSIYNILGKDAFNDKIELQGGKIDFNGANIGWLFKLLRIEPFNIVIPENMSDALKTIKPDDDVKKEFLAISADNLGRLKDKINAFIKNYYAPEEQ